ncbi:MAG: hypothetical protein NTW71_08875 [Deltaproteobacteria bacterium]|nr:hypothetical protein [Deltaproteobacteria bacterium]
MTRNEHLTRVELIDPILHDLGWTGALIEGVDFSALTGLPVEPNTLIQETKARLLA